MDVREESEWANGHIAGAKHISKGVLERDIEAHFPQRDTEILVYCGSGARVALAAKSLQEMGYTNVWNVAGGYKAMVGEKWETTK